MPALSTRFKEKAFFWKDYWPTNFIILRRRGDDFAPELVPGVRLKYGDRPNAHKLRTGERMPAVPKSYVLNGVDGTPWIFAVEADDDQIVVFKPTFDAEEMNKVDEVAELLDTDMDGEEIKDALEDKNYDIVKFSVLENKEERLSFLSEELKNSNTKYSPSNLIREYPQLTLITVTTVMMVVLLYAFGNKFGQYIPILENFNVNMGQFLQQAGSSGAAGGAGGAPPG